MIADEVRLLAIESEDARRHEIERLAASGAADIRLVTERVRASSAQAEAEAIAARGVLSQLETSRAELAALVNAGRRTSSLRRSEAEVAARESEAGVRAGCRRGRGTVRGSNRGAAGDRTANRTCSSKASKRRSPWSVWPSVARRQRQRRKRRRAVGERSRRTFSRSTVIVRRRQPDPGRGRADRAWCAGPGGRDDEANAAMGQIAAAAARAQASARGALQRLHALVGVAEESRATIDRLAVGIASALSETQGVLRRLGELRGSALQIENITNGLALLAVQTGMLAVSGAVEATRSSEAGRGFASVSADIRKLAQDAATRSEQGRH